NSNVLISHPAKFCGQCARWRDEVQVLCPGRGAAFFTLRRRAGTHTLQVSPWAPAQQRTTPRSGALRCVRGMRPGYAMNIRAAEAIVSNAPKAMKIFPISEV